MHFSWYAQDSSCLSYWSSERTLNGFEFAHNKLNKTRRGHKIAFRSVIQ